MTRYSLDTTGDGERDNPKAFMREDPEGAWVLKGDAMTEPLTVTPLDTEYDLLLAELAESPLDGARYAYAVVTNRRKRINDAAREGQGLDVERLRKCLPEAIEAEDIDRYDEYGDDGMLLMPEGEWVRYVDHVATLDDAREGQGLDVETVIEAIRQGLLHAGIGAGVSLGVPERIGPHVMALLNARLAEAQQREGAGE